MLNRLSKLLRSVEKHNNEALKQCLFSGRVMNMPILTGDPFIFPSPRFDSVTTRRVFVSLAAACAEGREEVE